MTAVLTAAPAPGIERGLAETDRARWPARTGVSQPSRSGQCNSSRIDIKINQSVDVEFGRRSSIAAEGASANQRCFRTSLAINCQRQRGVVFPSRNQANQHWPAARTFPHRARPAICMRQLCSWAPRVSWARPVCSQPASRHAQSVRQSVRGVGTQSGALCYRTSFFLRSRSRRATRPRISSNTSV